MLVKQVSDDSIVLATKHTDEEGKYSVYMYKLDAEADPQLIQFNPALKHEITCLCANSDHVIVTTKGPVLIIFKVTEPTKEKAKILLSQEFPAPSEVAIFGKSHCICVQADIG